jgi:hypothetical protein
MARAELPDIVRAQIMSGAVFGLSGAMGEKLSGDAGRIVQSNFQDYPILGLAPAPTVDVHIVGLAAHDTTSPQRGYGAVKDRQDHICQTVECRRCCLGHHATNTHEQSKGGGPERENLMGVCTADHLRGVHAGVLPTEGIKEAVLWTDPGRPVWVF